MREPIAIELTNGGVTWVSAEDEERVRRFRWWKGNRGYVLRSEYVRGSVRRTPEGKVRTKYRTILLHRFLIGAPPGIQVDHRDGNPLMNTRPNLRLATNAQNMANLKVGRGSSRFKGVSWHQLAGKWRARVTVGAQEIHLGLFDDETAAALEYDRAAAQYFGEFASTNFGAGSVGGAQFHTASTNG